MIKLIERKKIVTIVVFMAILITATVGHGVYNFGIKSGNIEVEKDKEEVKTSSETVEGLLRERKIELGKYDKINMDLKADLKDGFDIKIERAVKVVVTINGESKEVNTTEKTVEGLLNSEGIYYDQKDKVSPSLETKITPYLEISVIKVTDALKSLEEGIEFGYVERKNPDLDLGVTRVTEQGSKGKKVTEIRETFENSALVNTEVLSEVVEKEPVTKVIEVGTKVAPKVVKTVATTAPKTSTQTQTAAPKQETQTTRQETQTQTSSKPASKRSLSVQATAYDDNPANNGGYVGLTASGTKLRPGVIAVDPSVIPLGTRVYIEYPDGTPWGYGVAEDTGGAIKGNKIDIFMDASKTMSFGRRQMKVYIL